MAWLAGISKNRAHSLSLTGAWFAWLLMITPLPAMAANAFLLQLGNSDSQAAANEKWDALKASNSDVLAGLKLNIVEVALPPKETITYRTQAGPIGSREQAEKLCNTLKDRDVECYVVETALLDSEETQTQANPEETPAPQLQAERRKQPPVEESNDAHADDPDYVPPPVDSGPVLISASGETMAPPAAVDSEKTDKATQAEAEIPAPIVKSENNTADHFVPGRGPRFLDEENEQPPAKVTVAQSQPVPPQSPPQPSPVPATAKESPGFFSRLFGSNPPKPSDAEGVKGHVNVAEAVPVPLSNGDQPAQQKIVPTLPEVHGLGGSPSSPGDKTLWAQISYFRDETQALTFYRQFSAASPQLADDLRIRITKPFTATTSTGKVSLRVGPFLAPDDVNVLCAAAARWNARCTVVREVGSSVPTSRTGTHSSRGRIATHTITGAYWAQLGSYTSQQEAWDTWNDLKSAHAKLVKGIHSSVTTPALSSAEQPTYRLRGGPFTSKSAADGFCRHLQAIGTDCLVVNDR